MNAFMAERLKLEPVFPDVWVKQGDTFSVRSA